MNKTTVNTIVVCKNKYNTQEEFENAIKRAILVLLENDYIMTVRYDEKGLGIVCIDYDYADQSLGDTYPYWLSPEDALMMEYREESDNEVSE